MFTQDHDQRMTRLVLGTVGHCEHYGVTKWNQHDVTEHLTTKVTLFLLMNNHSGDGHHSFRDNNLEL